MTAPILVCGRRGQVAIDLVEAAGALGLPVVALGRPDLDITDGDEVARALDRVEPMAVINAAAYTAVDKAESEPDSAFALNRDGPAHLARACAARALPLIHLSTDQVFDGRKEGGFTEDDAPNPLCVYGASKLAGERAVAEAGGGHLVVRVSWVFGPSGDNFVAKVLGWTRGRNSLSIVSDQRGRPTYSPGLSRALLDFAGRMTASGGERPADAACPADAARPRGLLHLAGASVMTRFEQAELILAGSAARGGPTARVEPVLTADFPVPAARPLNAELDLSRARERYGIELGRFETDLDATLDRLLGPPRADGLSAASAEQRGA
jgi:dTDP-4-dehydrorhamnose reductase